MVSQPWKEGDPVILDALLLVGLVAVWLQNRRLYRALKASTFVLSRGIDEVLERGGE